MNSLNNQIKIINTKCGVQVRRTKSKTSIQDTLNSDPYLYLPKCKNPHQLFDQTIFPLFHGDLLFHYYRKHSLTSNPHSYEANGQTRPSWVQPHWPHLRIWSTSLWVEYCILGSVLEIWVWMCIYNEPITGRRIYTCPYWKSGGRPPKACRLDLQWEPREAWWGLWYWEPRSGKT